MYYEIWKERHRHKLERNVERSRGPTWMMMQRSSLASTL